MLDWVLDLGPTQRLLDLCSGPGSLAGVALGCIALELDEDTNAFATARQPAPGHHRIFGRSDKLPITSASVDLVICHHALEHVEDLPQTLSEVSRVLSPAGRLYVSVPNGYGLCDGIYRFLYNGGGHVNRFRRGDLIRLIESSVGVHLARWSVLYSSFVYLWRLREMMEAPPDDLAPRLKLISRLPPKAVTASQRLLYSATRAADRMLGSSLSVYGWALYFERRSATECVQMPGFVNVCRCCGAGHPARSLLRLAEKWFRCPSCQHVTPYCDPFGNAL